MIIRQSESIPASQNVKICLWYYDYVSTFALQVFCMRSKMIFGLCCVEWIWTHRRPISPTRYRSDNLVHLVAHIRSGASIHNYYSDHNHHFNLSCSVVFVPSWITFGLTKLSTKALHSPLACMSRQNEPWRATWNFLGRSCKYPLTQAREHVDTSSHCLHYSTVISNWITLLCISRLPFSNSIKKYQNEQFSGLSPYSHFFLKCPIDEQRKSVDHYAGIPYQHTTIYLIVHLRPSPIVAVPRLSGY